MSVKILQGDCRDVLRTLPDASVHCIVTSPPYYGLRDYGTATWEGGDAACGHVQGMARGDTSRETPGGRGGSFQGGSVQFRNVCGKCGARRIDSQIGLEQTSDAYVAQLVGVFREARRVLRDDGVLFCNLGDSYGSGKQLLGIPWRVAFALQADGWFLRQDIIWHKPNPMPESVTDRCCKSHEYVFLLSKLAKYYFDNIAIAEPAVRSGTAPGGNIKVDASRKDADRDMTKPVADNRNRRSVWTIATQPSGEAHFAMMPQALAELCVKAGTSEKGCCPCCGNGWARKTEYGRVLSTGGSDKGARATNLDSVSLRGETKSSSSYVTGNMVQREKVTIGWAPSCSCLPPDENQPVPATVLDPFAGVGTTGLVADRLGRDAVLIELSLQHAASIRRRLEGDAGMFAAIG